MASALEVINNAAQVLQPPPKITQSEWADEYRRISPEVSAYPGRWQTAKVPYLREIMDCGNDPRITYIVFMKPSRMAATEGLINNRIGFNVHLNPRPMLYAQKSLDLARRYSDQILEFLINDTLVVAERSYGSKATNTKLQKTFKGCSLSLVGANATGAIRLIEAHDIYCDDVDSWDYTIGEEGDSLRLIIGRADNAPQIKKIYIISSPTIEGFSRVKKWIKRSDQRFFNVPCPYCDHGQVLRFGGPDKDYGMKWKGEDPGSAYYLCEQCHKDVQEWHKTEMTNLGIWKATAAFTNIAGFQINRLYSLMIPWKEIVEQWLSDHKNPYTLQVFINTVLGETYEDRSSTVKGSSLYGRREMYGPEIPNKAPFATSGGDVQKDRIEVEWVNWGRDEESWNMQYKVFLGDTAKQQVWEDLDRWLLTPMKNENGNDIWITCFAIDSRYRAKQVGAFVRERSERQVANGVVQRIIAIKGANEAGKPPISDKPFSKKNVGKVHYYWVGTDTIKDTVFTYLALEAGEFGPGYMHYPVGDPDRNYPGRDKDYFKGLTSEKCFSQQDKTGQEIRVWKKKDGVNNEPLDCRVYAYAALMHLINNLGFNLNQYVDRVMQLIESSGSMQPQADQQNTGRRVISRGVDRSKYNL